jgi:AraC-like DNA-binding protein
MMDARTFLELNENGKSYSEIAAQFNTSRNVVAGAIWRAKNPEKDYAYQERLRAEKAAEVRAERLARIRAQAEAAKPQDERDETILQLRRDGCTYGEISGHVGITEQAVQQRFTRMITGRRPRGIVSRTSAEQRDRVVALHEDGASMVAISKQTGFSEYAIRKFLQNVGLQPRIGRQSGTYRDIAGERFGRLVAVRPAGRYRLNEYCWLCQCDCGGTKIVRIASLRTGSTRSCGCIKRGPRPKVAA